MLNHEKYNFIFTQMIGGTQDGRPSAGHPLTAAPPQGSILSDLDHIDTISKYILSIYKNNCKTCKKNSVMCSRCTMTKNPAVDDLINVIRDMYKKTCEIESLDIIQSGDPDTLYVILTGDMHGKNWQAILHDSIEWTVIK